MSDLVLVEDKGPVRWLTLNRPDKRNALHADLVTALKEALADPGDKLIKAMNLSPKEAADMTFYEGEGCGECHGTGFKGRIGIFEYLPIDNEIRKEVTENSDAERIKEVAIGNGLVTLRQDGWQKVKNGMTTIREVLRVTAEA